MYAQTYDGSYKRMYVFSIMVQEQRPVCIWAVAIVMKLTRTEYSCLSRTDFELCCVCAPSFKSLPQFTEAFGRKA